MRNGRQKIPSKREACEVLERERKTKTLKEIGEAWGITPSRVSQLCAEWGITDKPYRVRGMGGFSSSQDCC